MDVNDADKSRPCSHFKVLLQNLSQMLCTFTFAEDRVLNSKLTQHLCSE